MDQQFFNVLYLFYDVLCNISQQLSRTEVKILQRNRQEANSFVLVKI